MKCPVCIKPYNLKSNKKVTCIHCDYNVCIKCIEKYLLLSNKEPHCMSCRHVWNIQEVYERLSTSFINKLRKKDIKLLIEKEKGLILDTKRYIDYYKYVKDLEKRITENTTYIQIIKEKIKNIETKDTFVKSCVCCKANYVYFFTKYCYNCNTKLCLLCREEDKIGHVCKEFNKKRLSEYVQNIDLRDKMLEDVEKMKQCVAKWKNNYDMDENVLKKISEGLLICNCPYKDCKGIIYNYKCNICKTKICEKCYQILDDNHKCNLSEIKSIKTLKRTTKPCPKCATFIQKIDGCNQMWCTNCNNAFDWITGQIDHGPVHNPHYFEWCKTIGDEVHMRDFGNRTYEGVPNVRYFTTHVALVLKRIDDESYNYCILFYRLLLHVNNILFIDETLVDIVKNNLDLRLKWFFGEIDEKTWGNRLFLRKKNGQIKSASNDVFKMFSVASTNITHQILSCNERIGMKLLLIKLEKLVEYTNECFSRLNSVLNLKMPYIEIKNNNDFIVQMKHNYLN